MTKKIFLFLACVFFAIFLNAQGKLTAYTRAFLDNYAVTKTRTESTSTGKNNSPLFMKANLQNDIPMIGAFIILEEGADIENLENIGVRFYNKEGNIVTAEIPVDKIISVSEQEGVNLVDVEKPMRLLNDMSRKYTGGDRVQAGTNLSQPYTGAGVVVGICDQGIDFNHIAFMDAEGKSRVKRAYLPDDKTGTSPTGTGMDGRKYSGSAYETVEAIAKLTTDYAFGSHGTHTSGTAAGSYIGNDYYGYASAADLVLCGVKNLSDVNIANSIAYVFKYADSVNKPAVVNLSLGDHSGAHDGTGTLVQFMDNLSIAGRIITVAAGNEGDTPLYASKEFENPTDELKLLLQGEDANKSYYGAVTAWSRIAQPIGVKAVVYDLATEAIVYETPLLKSAGVSSITYTSAGIPELAKYYKGSISFYSELSNQNNKYNMYCQIDLSIPGYGTSKEQQPDYCLGIVYTGDAGQQMDVWADGDNTSFASWDLPGWTNGSSSCSINDMATGDNVISVGSYNSKSFYTSINGNEYSYGDAFPEKEISSFSSSGIDMRGISRPDVLAPGAIVVSSVNEYDRLTVDLQREYLAAETEANGRKYHWGDMMGTSMATPAVTGILALWLEADPTLTPARIKEILRETSIKDSYVNSEASVRSGNGKIDAYAGLLEVLKGTTGLNAERNINKVLISAPVDGNFQVFAPGETGRVTVNIYTPNGMLLYTTTQSNEGTVEVKASHLKETGIHILQVLGEKTNYRTKIMLK